MGSGCCFSDKIECIPANVRGLPAFIIQLMGQKINPYHSNIVK